MPGQREKAGLLPYVARLHAEWFAQAPGELHRRVPGTLVFADISGFTALTERLARKGKVGAEEMSDALNAVFSDILEPAHEDGADLVKWGGDAVLLLFKDENHEARACRAAYNMRARLRTVGTLVASAGAVKLRMSVGVHSGVFDFYLVGDPTQHRELLTSGPEVSRCVRLESVANAGDIAISYDTLAVIGPSYAGREVSDDGVLLKGCPDPPGAIVPLAPVSVDLSVLLPQEIRAHLLRGAADPEHRDIAVGFVKFTGTDRLAIEEGPEAVALALDEVVRNVSSATDEFGVTFFETDLDADGGKVMLAAGVPASAGHHAERMLRATRLMLDRAGRLPLKIGVNHGHVFSGDFGPEFRRTYSIKGDPINLAARVMGKAQPGTLLATRAAIEKSETVFDVRVLEPFMVKGKTEPVQAFEVGAVTESSRRSHASMLVGRASELEQLEAAVARLSTQGQAIDLVGAPGIGKSRMLTEVERFAGDRPLHFVQCVEYDEASPYHLFWVLLHNVLNLVVAAPQDEAVPAFRAHVERVAPDLMPWFPLLCIPLEYTVDDTPETQGLDDEFRRAKTEEVVAELIHRVLPGEAVLLFDDVQFLDSASVGVLNRLVSDLRTRSLLVVLGRTDVETGWRPAPGSDVHTIKLEPLSLEDSVRMVQGAHADRPLPPQVAHQLANKAGGNPLFLHSLVEAAGPTGDVTDLPDTIADLVTTRIDRLSPDDKTILRRAAVLGTGFDLEQLPLLFDEPPADAALDRLGEFLHVERTRRWATFRHALMRDVAYAGLPYRQRQQLHARVGAALERAEGTISARPELLSLHFFNAHRFDKAWAYARQAGDVAKAKYANAEAADQYVRAIDSARRLPAQVVPRQALGSTYEALADSWFTVGFVEQALKAYHDAYRLFRLDPVDAARVVGKQAGAEQRLRRLPQSLARITRELRLLGDEPSARLAKARSILLYKYAMGRLSQGRHREAINVALDAVREGRVSEDLDAMGRAYTALQIAHLASRQPMDEPWGQLALDAAVKLGDLVGQAHAANNLAFETYNQHRWSESAEMFAKAADAFHQLGDTANEGNALCNQGEVLVNQGRFLEAIPILEEAVVDARATSDEELVALGLRQLGRACIRAGNVELGLEHLAHSRTMFESIDERGELAGVDVLRAEAMLYDCDFESALELTDRLLDEQPSDEVAPSLAWVRGFTLLALKREGEAAGEFDRGRALAVQGEDPFSQAISALGSVAAGADVEGERKAEAAGLLERLGVVTLPRGLDVPDPTEP